MSTLDSNLGFLDRQKISLTISGVYVTIHLIQNYLNKQLSTFTRRNSCSGVAPASSWAPNTATTPSVPLTRTGESQKSKNWKLMDQDQGSLISEAKLCAQASKISSLFTTAH